jgi:hypothetical protein
MDAGPTLFTDKPFSIRHLCTEADMATAWQTLEEAALTLGISSRTLHRRLAKGEFQTRLENNRREVLITIAEPDNPDMSADVLPPGAQPTGAQDASDTSVDADPSDDMSADVQTTLLALHEDRIRRTDLAIMAYQQSVNVTAADARRAHVASRVAWGATAAVTTALFLATTWATHRVTRAEGEVEHLSSVVRQLSDTADAKTRQADALRHETEAAHVAAARIEGQLTATKLELQRVRQTPQPVDPVSQPAASVSQPAITPSAAAPTTRPSSLRQRLAQFLLTE